MSIIDLQRHQAEAVVRDLHTLPALPGSAAHLLAEISNSGADSSCLAAIIKQDVTLATKVLKVANSPFYGQSRHVDSVDRALVVMGLDIVRNIAVASSLDPLFRGGRITLRFHLNQLWRHSLGVALLADILAHHHAPELRGHAFLAGLLHDVGVLVAVHQQPLELERLALALDQQPDLDQPQLAVLEQRHLRACHDQLGWALLGHWLLPEPLREAAGNHHQPTITGAAPEPLTALIAVADHASGLAGLPMLLDGAPAGAPWHCLAALGICDATLDGLLAAEGERIRSLAAQLGG